MARFDFIIGDDGRAKPVIPVTVFLTTEEEKEAMIEAAKRRTLRLIEWHPIKTRPLTDEELRYYYDTYGADSVPDSMLCGEMPEDDQTILITYRMKSGGLCVAVDTCTCDEWGYYLEDFDDFEQVVAWAEMPEPYKPREEGTT